MTSQANFVVAESGDVCVASLEGEVDVSNATEVRDEIVGALSNEPLALVLDLSSLSYLDSSGVAVLFSLARSLQDRRQRLVLVVPDASPLWRLLKVTRVADTIPIELDRDAAKLTGRALEGDFGI